MSNAVFKPAAWLRSNPALQSAKNNVRRVPGSDPDSLHRLRWRAQRYLLAPLACCGRTSRSGAASAARERGRAPGLSLATVHHWAAVSEQPFRHRELVRPTARVRSNRSSPIPGAAPGRRRGRLGFRLAPGRVGFLARRAGGVRRWDGAGRRGWLGTRVQRLRRSFGALCVSGHSVGSTPLSVTGPERIRGSGLGELRFGGAAAPLPHLGRRKVKWKTVTELSPSPLPRRRSLGRRWGEVRSVGLEGKQEAWAVPPPPSSRPRPPGFTQHFFVLKAPPPPRGFSPRGRLTGGWGIEPSARPPFSPDPSSPPRPAETHEARLHLADIKRRQGAGGLSRQGAQRPTHPPLGRPPAPSRGNPA